jgi:hypothetical protein
LTSEFIKKIELPALLDAVEKRGLVIFWVAVEHSMYDVTYISKFQAVNEPSKPLASLSTNRANQEIVKICNKIKEAIQ